jgi:hypothetical protein
VTPAQPPRPPRRVPSEVHAESGPPIPRLALRRAEVLVALGVSEEIFDRHVRRRLPVVRLSAVRLYPVAGIERFLADRASSPTADARLEDVA